MRKLCNVLLSVLLFVFALPFFGCKDEPAPKPQPEHATFYNIEKAYENGWISDKDLLTVAADYNEDYSIVKHRVTPQITVEKVDEIKRCYLEKKANRPNGKLNSIEFERYLGVYDDFYVVQLEDTFIQRDILYIPEYEEYTIGKATFHDYRPNLYLWYE